MWLAACLYFAMWAMVGCRNHAAVKGDDFVDGSSTSSPDSGSDSVDEKVSDNGFSGIMPVKTIYLARHGRTHMNRIGWINGRFKWDHLDPLGYRQRVGLFALLKDEPIHAVFVSELNRTRQTADPLAKHFGLTPIIAPELNEFSGGIFEGMCQGAGRKLPPEDPRSECFVVSDDSLVKMGDDLLLEEILKSQKGGIDYRAPGGGESVRDVSKRLKLFFAKLSSLPVESEILIVGHGGTNRFLLALLMGWNLEDSRKIRQGHTQVFRLTRTEKTPPDLDVFVNGRWTGCSGPPDPKKGLECLRSD